MIAAALLIGITIMLQAFPVPTFEPIRSPTAIPTSTPFELQATVIMPQSDIYNGLATAERSLNDAPEQINNPSWLPNQSGYQLFSYAKWMFGASSSYEVFGPFGGIITHLAVGFALQLIITAIYFIVLIVRFVLRWVTWIIQRVFQFIPFFG